MKIHAIRVNRAESGSPCWKWVGSTQEDWLNEHIKPFDVVERSRNVFEARMGANGWEMEVDGKFVPVDIYTPKEHLCCDRSEH